MSLYEDWIDSKNELKSIKEIELNLRNKIIESLVDSSDYGKNKTLKIEDDGFKIKIGLGLSKSIDIAELDSIWEDLEDEEKASIVWKPTIVTKKFSELEENRQNSKLFNCITEKQRQSTLSIEHKDE